MIARAHRPRPSRWPLFLLALPAIWPAARQGAAGEAIEEKAPAGDPARWVDERVERWQPKPEERRIDEIGWAADIREALRLSRESRRPVFLFTHDGRMGVGRC